MTVPVHTCVLQYSFDHFGPTDDTRYFTRVRTRGIYGNVYVTQRRGSRTVQRTRHRGNLRPSRLARLRIPRAN